MKQPLGRGDRKRRAGNRPIACVTHTPNYEPDCFQCRNLLELILRGEDESDE